MVFEEWFPWDCIDKAINSGALGRVLKWSKLDLSARGGRGGLLLSPCTNGTTCGLLDPQRNDCIPLWLQCFHSPRPTRTKQKGGWYHYCSERFIAPCNLIWYWHLFFLWSHPRNSVCENLTGKYKHTGCVYFCFCFFCFSPMIRLNCISSENVGKC